jgi:hypothetical protein
MWRMAFVTRVAGPLSSFHFGHLSQIMVTMGKATSCSSCVVSYCGRAFLNLVLTTARPQQAS